jgi:ABC-type transport system substrate-binding protein
MAHDGRNGGGPPGSGSAPAGQPRSAGVGRLVAATLACLLLMVASACASESGTDTDSAASGDTPQPGGRLAVGIPLPEPDVLLHLVFEPLTTFDADGNVVPYLAESVEPNEEFDRWTIRVRDGITFQNGEALDAAAVKVNLDTYSTSTFATDPFAPIVGTTVVDPLTLEVEMAQPWAAFPAALAAEQSDGTGLIAAPETVDSIGPLFLARPDDPGVFGTGPFTIDEQRSTSSSWALDRNPDYWQDGLPYIDELDIKVIPELSSRMAELESGGVDLIVTNSPPQGDGATEVLTQGGEPEVLAVALNTARAPTDDLQVREALVAATDVEALAVTAGVDADQLATGPFGPDSPWTDLSVPGQSFDLERARALVDDYESANGPIQIELGAQALETESLAVQQQLAQQWTEAGVDVEISVIDPFAQTANLLVDADFDAVIESLFGMPDPDLNYFWWHSSARRTPEKSIAYNYVGLDDPAIDEALDVSRATTDGEIRREAMGTVQERMHELSPYVWLWATPTSTVSNPRIRGIGVAPLPDGGTRWPLLGRGPNLEGIWRQR